MNAVQELGDHIPGSGVRSADAEETALWVGGKASDSAALRGRDRPSVDYSSSSTTPGRRGHVCNCVGCCRDCGACRTSPEHTREVCAARQEAREYIQRAIDRGRVETGETEWTGRTDNMGLGTR